jgi:hypothetical protein
MPDTKGPPHAGRQLDLLAQKVTDAHAQLAVAAAAAADKAVAATHAARETAAQRRRDRLALIEERNKRAASRPVDHAAG